MASIPQNNNFQYLQTYTALYWTGNMCLRWPLATSSGAVYQPGLLMCIYTGGGNSGLAGDYLAAGSNGQNVCVGIFDDQNYPQSTASTATSGKQALIRFAGQGRGVSNSALTATNTPDIPTGMAAVGARLISQFGSSGMWYWP